MAAVSLLLLIQSCNRSGSKLDTGKVETTDHGTIYHLKDGWLIVGTHKKDGGLADKAWMLLLANRDKGTQFEVQPGGLKWSSDEPAIKDDEGHMKSSEWTAFVKADFRDAATEGELRVTTINVSEPRLTSSVSLESKVLESVKSDPSKYSAYDLYELKGGKAERPTS